MTKKIETFLNECDCFMFITNNGYFPSARPFGIAVAIKDKLYLCTNKKKNVFKQVLKNSHVHVVAIKRNSRTWIRFNAIAKPSDNMYIKKKVFDSRSRLKVIYKTPSNPNFQLLELKITRFEKHLD